MSAGDVRVYLSQLMAERLEAGFGENAVYMSELEVDLAAAREAYVGLAVTEIATLRGQLSGRQVGGARLAITTTCTRGASGYRGQRLVSGGHRPQRAASG